MGAWQQAVRRRRWGLALAACLGLFGAGFASEAEAATGVRLGLGADYWVQRTGLFNLTFAVDGQLARSLSVGGRFGAMVSSGPAYVGVPVDLLLRATVGGDRVYLEGLVGPWFLFNSAYPLRMHAGFGFGLQASAVTLGLEVAWLDPDPMVGLRLGFRL